MFGCVSARYANQAAHFTIGSKTSAHFTAVTRLDTAEADPFNTGVTAKDVLLNVRTCARTAHDEPSFADKFHAPTSPGQAALLTNADAYLFDEAKVGVAAKFIANDFQSDLTAKCAVIEEANVSMESDGDEGVESTAPVSRLFKAGMRKVNCLNAVLLNKYNRATDKLVAWKLASRVDHALPAGEETNVSAADGVNEFIKHVNCPH